jgi:NADH-quinone oxidoreductase subunit L
MTLPLVVLAVGAVFGGLLCLPHWVPVGSGVLEHWLHPVVQTAPALADRLHHHPLSLEIGLMFVSIVVALGGIAFATLVYKTGAISAERFSRIGGGFPHRVLENKWYIDELYQATIVAGTLLVTRVLAWFDRTVIDGIVNGAAAVVRSVAWLEGRFDALVVDGTVNAVADGTYAFGRTIKQIQTGTISAYLMVIVAGVLGGVFVYVYWASAGMP